MGYQVLSWEIVLQIPVWRCHHCTLEALFLPPWLGPSLLEFPKAPHPSFLGCLLHPNMYLIYNVSKLNSIYNKESWYKYRTCIWWYVIFLISMTNNLPTFHIYFWKIPWVSIFWCPHASYRRKILKVQLA